jgi:hypothetical protein
MHTAESVPVTDALLEAGKTQSGGWTKAQLEILGVAWPPQPGWKQKVRGTLIPKSDAERFLALSKADRTQQERLF